MAELEEDKDVEDLDAFIYSEGSKKIILTDKWPQIEIESRIFNKMKSEAHGKGPLLMRNLVQQG